MVISSSYWCWQSCGNSSLFGVNFRAWYLDYNQGCPALPVMFPPPILLSIRWLWWTLGWLRALWGEHYVRVGRLDFNSGIVFFGFHSQLNLRNHFTSLSLYPHLHNRNLLNHHKILSHLTLHHSIDGIGCLWDCFIQKIEKEEKVLVADFSFL